MLPSLLLKPTFRKPSSAPGARVVLQHLDALIAAAALAMLRAYKMLVSPFFTGCCRFYPSCADYSREAVLIHGGCRGIRLGVSRLCRCHPWGGHGVDPVPRG